MADDTSDWITSPGYTGPPDDNSTDFNYTNPTEQTPTPADPNAANPNPAYFTNAAASDAGAQNVTDQTNAAVNDSSDPYGLNTLTQQASDSSLTGRRGGLIGGAEDLIGSLMDYINDDHHKMGVNLGANVLAGLFNSKYKEGALKAQQTQAEAYRLNAESNAAQAQNEIAIRNQQMANSSAKLTYAPTGLIYHNLLAAKTGVQ